MVNGFNVKRLLSDKMNTVKDKDLPASPGKNKGFRVFMLLFLLWALTGAVLYAAVGNHSLFRSIHSTHTPAWDQFFYYYTFVGDFVVIGPLLLLVWLGQKEYRKGQFFLLLIVTQLLPLLAVQGIKLWVNAPRPSVVFGESEWFHRIAGLHLHAQLSFPSGHTAGAFACFTLLSILLPAGRASWSILFFFLAFLVAYSRMYLGQHFFEDIYVGSLLGTSLSALSYIFWAKFLVKR